MAAGLNWSATGIFLFFLVLVTVLGFWSARWRRGNLGKIEEWSLGGRRFGTIVTWFLIGGDFYTAYTLIAVPALVYGVGANGFFALVYTIIVYPFVFLVMPRLWRVSRRRNYVNIADFARGRYGSRSLAGAVAVTGILATLPYIALQLIGMQVSIAALGFQNTPWAGDAALIAAFIILAAYDYTSGLRAPAMISLVKGVMIYIIVLVAVIWIPIQIGGYRHIFAAASRALASHHPAGAMILPHALDLPFATLALGSAFAGFLYPHNITSILSASHDRVIQRNAVFLPAYTFVLGLIALLGYVALAADVHIASPNDVIPALFNRVFPPWFAGFCFAGIAIGALVPAAIMSIACASLFTRNLYREYINPRMTQRQESSIAKFVSLLFKLVAVVFVIFGDRTYAINLQLLGGIWILQVLPAVVLGLYQRWLHPSALLVGWASGMAVGTAMGYSLGLKSAIYPLRIAGLNLSAYAAIDALIVNLVVAVLLTALFRHLGSHRGSDETVAADYEPEIPAAATA